MQDGGGGDFVFGEPVDVVAGKYAGKLGGTFAKKTPQRVAVQFPGKDGLVFLGVRSVVRPPRSRDRRGDSGGGGSDRFGANGISPPGTTAAAGDGSSGAGTAASAGERTRPNLAERTNTTSTPPPPAVPPSPPRHQPRQPGRRRQEEEEEEEEEEVEEEEEEEDDDDDEEEERQPCPWRVPGGDDPLLRSSLGMTEEYRRLNVPGAKMQEHRTFAYRLFRNRIATFKSSIECKVVPRRWTDGRCRETYELLSSKLHRNNKITSNGHVIAGIDVTLVYVLVSGPKIVPIDLKTELEKVAGFGYLPPEKVAARLELFQSTARTSNRVGRDYLIFEDMDAKEFELIPEVANEGCGFIPRSYIHKFFGNHAVGKRTFALQVRVFIPLLGIFKGVLMEKPGIDKIQLPESMRKVPPSTAAQNSSHACLLVNNNGMFPSTKNLQIVKALGNEKKEKELPKELSKMIRPLLKSQGVPDSLLERYVKETYRKLGHACLVGVADPTGGLPEGCVFVTGLAGICSSSSGKLVDRVFVSRFPCTENSDGYKLPLVQSKPPAMSDSIWEWLNSLHFGGIIFSTPQPGQAPLPKKIANGDLDGDLFFVLWDREVVSCIRSRDPPSVGVDEEASQSAQQMQWDDEWLSRGQETMRSVETLAHQTKLITCLYCARKKAMDAQGYDGPDTIAFGRAYKAAIDIGKHGGRVALPSRLWKEVPEALHSYLISEKEV